MRQTTKALAFAGGVMVLVIAGFWAWSVWYDVPVRAPPHGDRGCWALLFGGKEFYPPVARLKGPTFIEKFENEPVVTPELQSVGGEVFLRTVQSAIVGPHAELIGYREISFDNASLRVGPDDQVPDLTALRFHERVKSLKLECR